MAANKQKVITLDFGGKEYSAKWNTLAYRQYLQKMTELAQIDGGFETQAAGLKIIHMAEDILKGMLMRAGVAEEAIDDMDADVFAAEAKRLNAWFNETMAASNEKLKPTGKNAVAVGGKKA